MAEHLRTAEHRRTAQRHDHPWWREHLAAACRGRIDRYKIPGYWKIVDSFPMTVTGKIQKFRMREITAEELG